GRGTAAPARTAPAPRGTARGGGRGCGKLCGASGSAGFFDGGSSDGLGLREGDPVDGLGLGAPSGCSPKPKPSREWPAKNPKPTKSSPRSAPLLPESHRPELLLH